MRLNGGPLGASVIVELSIRAGIAALILTAVLLAVALTARLLLDARRRRRLSVERRWTPVILAALRDEEAVIPALAPRDRTAVLALWNRLAESITGGGRQRLVKFARRAGLADVAYAGLGSRNPTRRLASATLLGHLHDLRAVHPLRQLMGERSIIVRAQAARALVRLEPVAGPRWVVPRLAVWPDCHPATFVAVLRDADPAATAEAVAAAAGRATDLSTRVRLVRVLASIPHPGVLGTVHEILERAEEPELISACLQVIAEHREPGDAALVRPYLKHPLSFVRVQAVAALGRLRAPGDEWRIVAMLGDRDWWVRYRSAHALRIMPRVSEALLDYLSRIHPDRYARGALEHVLTEMTPA